jgi:phosphoglycolate phosphatase-like HAD superfamily hydrolase
MFSVDTHETLMVGDSGYDIAAGKGAEVLTIGCDYGYGSAEELRGADRIVSSIGEIIPILTSGDCRCTNKPCFNQTTQPFSGGK